MKKRVYAAAAVILFAAGLLLVGQIYGRESDTSFFKSEALAKDGAEQKVLDVLDDMNILLPVHRFQELATKRRIGGLAQEAYSFMGYQGYPRDTTAWRETYGPEVARKLLAERVECVLLTPT